jgi:hypothetical protein
MHLQVGGCVGGNRKRPLGAAQGARARLLRGADARLRVLSAQTQNMDGSKQLTLRHDARRLQAKRSTQHALNASHKKLFLQVVSWSSLDVSLFVFYFNFLFVCTLTNDLTHACVSFWFCLGIAVQLLFYMVIFLCKLTIHVYKSHA